MSVVPGLGRALARAAAGKSLDHPEVVALLQARGVDLLRLCELAGAERDRGLLSAGRPGIITYSRKVFVPLTRLCRDRCHYCTFATTPGRLPAPFLDPDQVLAIARAGADAGCKEALFTLGDRPEARWREAREWLDSRGYADTLSYLRAMAVLVLEETGLLPHLNPGVMTWAEIQRLKPVAPSMGMMLETTSRRLFESPGACHYGSPDKDPAVRLAVLDAASRSAVPFTTGVLVGVGETVAERADSLFAIRKVSRQYRAIQEVLIQNFRAKPDTAMRGTADPDFEEHLATVSTARLVLGPQVRIQVPPNLSRPDLFGRLLDAGVDDWGGVSPVTPDHVNPERPWPDVDWLADLTREAGYELRERLTVHPEYVLRGDPWLDPRVVPHVRALADPMTGLADPDARATGRPWQEPDVPWVSSGRVDLHTDIDLAGRLTAARSDFDDAYGDWESLRDEVADRSAPHRLDASVRAALRSAERHPARLGFADALSLMTAEGPELDEVCRLADAVRVDAVGEDVTYVVNRNINFTNVCYTGCRFCAFAQRESDADSFTLSLDEVGERAAEAWASGATEVCMQGGIHPKLPGSVYFDLAAEVKRRAPGLHLHAFSPMEVVNGAARTGLSVREWLSRARAAGLDSIPGTAAEILDDEVRWVLTKGKLPAADWVEVIETAHELGIPSTATMMYGHVDEPRHWVAHLRVIAELQERTRGFTEFVPLPFVHQSAPVYLAGIARPGPTKRDNRAVHALSRLLLHGLIDNIQCSWVKLGEEGCADLLRGGANDLGGTLMEETISRMAGSTNGSVKTVAELRAIAERAGRPARQRTTTYGVVPAEREVAASRFDEAVRRRLPLLPHLTT